MIEKFRNIGEAIEKMNSIDTFPNQPLLLPAPKQAPKQVTVTPQISPKIKKLRELVNTLVKGEGLADNPNEKKCLVNLLDVKRDVDGELTFSDPERKHLNALFKSFFPDFSKLSLKRQVALLEAFWDIFRTGIAYYKLYRSYLDDEEEDDDEEEVGSA